MAPDWLLFRTGPRCPVSYPIPGPASLRLVRVIFPPPVPEDLGYHLEIRVGRERWRRRRHYAMLERDGMYLVDRLPKNAPIPPTSEITLAWAGSGEELTAYLQVEKVK